MMGNILLSLADVKARIAALNTAITDIQVDVDKVWNYLDALANHTVTPTLIPPLDIGQLISDVKEGMAIDPRLSLPNDSEEDIWRYSELLQITFQCLMSI